MASVLILSSVVAASRVGANVSAFCLHGLGHETVILPTTLLGRHPGWGIPGGGSVDPSRLRDIWAGVSAQGLHFDAVLTGYMADTDHVNLAAEIIDLLRAANPALCVLVDPIMGDLPRGLYVSPEIASFIAGKLAPRADILTPNRWELHHLTGLETESALHIDRAARKLPCPQVLTTSVPQRGDIGAMLTLQPGQSEMSNREMGNSVRQSQSWSITHSRYDRVPHGGGDMLAALFLGHVLRGAAPQDALARAASCAYAVLSDAVARGLPELSLRVLGEALLSSPPLTAELFQ